MDWDRLAQDLDERGCAVIQHLIPSEECDTLAALYPLDAPFRSRVVMARHGFGRGEYKYFDYPLPGVVNELRTALYPHLAVIANRWDPSGRFPERHAQFLKRCHAAGQR